MLLVVVLDVSVTTCTIIIMYKRVYNVLFCICLSGNEVSTRVCDIHSVNSILVGLKPLNLFLALEILILVLNLSLCIKKCIAIHVTIM